MKASEIFKSTKDNTIYISEKAAGIEIMVAALDGLRLVTFDGNKTTHLLLTQVIAWHEKETELGGNREAQKSETLNTLRRIEKDFNRQTGKTVDMAESAAQCTTEQQKGA
ncbi:MAG: hypothetical protein WCP55_25460 [Lentisphaerota bacterium]